MVKLTKELRAQGVSNIQAAINAVGGMQARMGAAHDTRGQAGAGGAAAPPAGATTPGAAAEAAVAAVIAPEHQDKPPLPHLLSELAFYPKHKQRTESPEYRKVRRRLVVNLDLPCIVCGVRNSTLKDPKENPFGASQIETHHHTVEWAFSNAVDVGKFNARIVPGLARRNPRKTLYQQPMTQAQIVDWIDHDPDNLWVLCDVHHRHKWVGIHAISGPIWGPQDLLVAGFGPQDAGNLPDGHH